MRWGHDASAEWAAARRCYLTATDVAGLVPGYEKALKSGKGVIPSGVLVPSFVKLWGEKHSSEEPETRSDGAAARGHIMEPYAVADYVWATGIQMHHWDDCLVVSNDVLAFSPDALDMAQPTDESGCGRVIVKATDISPKRLMEIKSFSIVKHYDAMLEKDKMSSTFREQRLQMAAGLMVCPTIETATLLNYNPAAYATHSMVVNGYSRNELEPEMEIIVKVVEEWKKTCAVLSEMDTGMSATVTELDIWQREMQPKFEF